MFAMTISTQRCFGAAFQAVRYWDAHPTVGFSALCFAVPAIVHFAYAWCVLANTRPSKRGWRTTIQLALYVALGVMFTGLAVTCWLAEWVYLKQGHRSFCDHIGTLAMVTFCLSFVSHGVRFSLRLVALSVVVAAVACANCRLSTVFDQWVLRHCLWHAVAAGMATKAALHNAPKQAYVRKFGIAYLLKVGWIFATAAGVMLSVEDAISQKSWRGGTQIADWKPVVELRPSI